MKIIANEYTEKDIIKILREWTELTQEKFSESINLSTSTIQSYELGTRNYKFSTLKKIAKKYNFVIIIEKK